MSNTHHQTKTTNKIAFIGCGNMAKAIISGLVNSGWPADQIMASNPSQPKLDKLHKELSIQITQDNLVAAEFADTLVFAVKPQKLSGVCALLTELDFSNKLIISVAAGYKADNIAAYLGNNTAIVRAMPNTPALIGVGATGIYANERVSTQQKQLTNQIFDAIGSTDWVTDESHINIVTAVAGSSPAYVFLLMQSMIEQAVESGLSEKAAFNLVTQAVSGAAQLAQAIPEKSLNTLRTEVTSPGGTTAAAIQSFTSSNFEEIIKEAVKASIQRGIELGQQA